MDCMILDGYNLLHRARFGFRRGEYFVIFNFIRGIRSIIEKFNPKKVYFVLEGKPRHREQIASNYKANRKIEESDPKFQEMKEFHRQKNLAINLMKEFPITIIRHPGYECDDTIANLVERHKEEESLIVSSDSDFNQLLNTYTSLNIYNPVKKSFVEKTDYCYLTWKSLRGDKTDNIEGIKGCGDKTALRLVEDPTLLESWLSKDETRREIMNRNLSLIRLKIFSDREWEEIEEETFSLNECLIKEAVETFKFTSMLKEKTWKNFIKTFKNLEEKREIYERNTA